MDADSGNGTPLGRCFYFLSHFLRLLNKRLNVSYSNLFYLKGGWTYGELNFQ